MAGKIIPVKIKKPEITKTLNISSGGDSQQQETQREREEGKKASCLNSICSLGSDKKHSEESNAAGMTTVHLNNTIIPCH